MVVFAQISIKHICVRGDIVVHNTCPKDCYDTCSIITEVDGGKIIGIQGNRAHPVTQGFLCSRTNNFGEHVYGEDRVLYPLLRKDGRLERVSWDEALDVLEEKIVGYGGENILRYTSSGHMGWVAMNFPERFFGRIGGATTEETVCNSAGKQAIRLIYGHQQALRPEELASAKMIILWGANLAWTGVHSYTFVQEAVAKGTKVVVIDPVETATARSVLRAGGQYLKIKPGTDGFLAYGLANYLISEGLYARDFVEENVYGFSEFAAEVRDYDLKGVAQITGITEADIAELAKEMAEGYPLYVVVGWALQRQRYGGDLVRGIVSLPALLGMPRGFYYSNSVYGLNLDYAKGSHLGKERRYVNQTRLASELKEFKMVFVDNANPVASLPNSFGIIEQLKRDDLFVVVHDLFLNDTTDYADLVLPATSFYETYDLHTSYYHQYISINQKAIEPLGEACSNSEMYRRLAKKMGYTEPELYEDDLTVIRKLVEGNSRVEISFEELLERGFVALTETKRDEYPTPSGKIELVSQSAVKQGLRAVAKMELPEVPEGMLRLITPAHKDVLRSQNQQRELHRKAEIYIHPDDAKGFSDGQWVTVSSSVGSGRFKLVFSLDTQVGTIFAYSSFWAKLSPSGQVNQLTIDEVEEYAGGSIMNSTFVWLE